jgi:tetratricopeptide (TPR) repeat protein
METLYDLLGALPRDDAEELRVAFRRAVKGAHPDLNPNDPDAGQKFREIVRANEILGDEEQRAAYDHLLDLAHRERKQQANAKVMHKAATSMIALVVVAGFGLGGYLAYQVSPEFAVAVNHFADATLVRPGDFAGIAPPASAKTPPPSTLFARIDALPAQAKTPAAAADTRLQIASAEPSPAPDRKAMDVIVPIPVTPITITVPQPAEPDATASAAVGPPLQIAPGDPKVFRERGIFAYRSGDLDGAVAEFDRAIRLDPKFSAAYVDRSIVLYRMQKFERAFADIAQAKRLEKASRSARTAQPAAPKKPKVAQASASLGISMFQPRTARLEANTP